MTLSETTRRDALGILGSTSIGWAEPVTYRFKDGTPERTFLATVIRLDMVPEPGARPVSKRRARIEIPRDELGGITAVTNGDTILVSMRIGDPPQECRVLGVWRQSQALFVVEVEA